MCRGFAVNEPVDHFAADDTMTEDYLADTVDRHG